MKIKKTLTLIILLALTTALFACRDAGTELLKDYRAKMSDFFDKVSTYTEAMNQIDPASIDAGSELLKQLDALGEQFEALRGFEIPEDFRSLSNITVDAADSMKEAVRLFHEAYNGTYKDDIAEKAFEYYERACKCLTVIIQVLNGVTPSVEGVTYQ